MKQTKTGIFYAIYKRFEPKRLNSQGFIPLILTLLAVMVAVIVLVYLRVLKAQK